MQLETEKTIFIVSSATSAQVEFLTDLLKLLKADVQHLSAIDKISSDKLSDGVILWDQIDYPYPQASIEKYPDSLHLLFNANRDTLGENEFLATGYHGVIYRDDEAPIIVKALNWACKGDLWFSRQTLSTFVVNALRNQETAKPMVCEQTARLFESLTRQELKIIRYVVEGLTNQEIAETLGNSVYTIKAHIYNIYRKLRVKNRIEAIHLGKKVQPLLRHDRKVRRKPRIKPNQPKVRLF